MLLRSLCLAAALTLAAPAAAFAADETVWVEGIDDLPLMPGLAMDPAAPVEFDKPQGRIVMASASGAPTVQQIQAFYAGALPALGWKGSGTVFTRGQEQLTLELGRSGSLSHVRFSLTPQ